MALLLGMFLKLNRTFSSILMLLLSVLSVHALAVQPMTETDLEIVSASTGNNILNIYGSSQAGLKIDESDIRNLSTSEVKLSQEKYSEGEAATPAAINKLQYIEQKNLQTSDNDVLAPSISNVTQTTIVKLNEFTSGEAAINSTNSQINYKTSNVNHEMRNIENGGVAVSRDLQVDLLKLENLRGINVDDGRSAGSIYLSNWRSLGDTRIISSER